MSFKYVEGVAMAEAVFEVEPGTLSEPIYDESVSKNFGYWLLEVVEVDEEQGSHTRGILLASRYEAEEVKAKLDAGEDFVELAGEYSQHLTSKDSGGELGWIQKGLVGQALGEVIFGLEPGVVSEPVIDEMVQTKGGYWLVQVLERDADRELDDDARGTLKFKDFMDWVEEERAGSLVENYLSDEQKAWAVEQVLKDRG